MRCCALTVSLLSLSSNPLSAHNMNVVFSLCAPNPRVVSPTESLSHTQNTTFNEQWNSLSFPSLSYDWSQREDYYWRCFTSHNPRRSSYHSSGDVCAVHKSNSFSDISLETYFRFNFISYPLKKWIPFWTVVS